MVSSIIPQSFQTLMVNLCVVPALNQKVKSFGAVRGSLHTGSGNIESVIKVSIIQVSCQRKTLLSISLE